MSAKYPGYEEYMRSQGYDFWNPGIDDTQGSGFWYSMAPDRDNGGYMMAEAPDLYSDWASQYNTRWANWMRGLEGNNQNNYLGGTAGLVAPGYMGGLWDEKMLGYNYTPEQLAARQAFQNQYAGYGQISPEHIQYGPNGEIQIKNAGPSAGDYVIDNSLIQFDPTYGAISPLSNFGHAGSKGGHSDAFKALAPIALAALGGHFLSGLEGAAGVNAGGLDGVLGDAFVNGITPGTYGAGVEASLAGLGEMPWGVNKQGGNMGFFDDILNYSTQEIDGSMQSIFDSANTYDYPIFSNEQFLPGSFEIGPSGYGTSAATGLDLAALEKAITGFNPINSIKSLLGGGASGTNLGNLLGGNPLGSRSIFDTAVSTAPFLAAINYAKNQDPFDTSRLNSLYDQYNPQASAFEYDQNTALGRRNLNDSLTSRGVMGSSFGNFDINSFNTNRELGRNALINQSAGVAGNLANSILDAQIKGRATKNELIGRSLAGLGSALSPKSVIPGY